MNPHWWKKEPAAKPVSFARPIATNMWPGTPEIEPPPPVEPLSPPGWQAFVEVEPAERDATTEVDVVPVVDRPWADPYWADDDLVVRPYVRTYGRTTQGYDLRLETMVAVTRLHEREPANPALTQDVLLICEICCAVPQSVAEVAVYLNAPLGVTRVLIADAIEAGLVFVDHGTAVVDARPSRELLERVRDGLLRMT